MRATEANKLFCQRCILGRTQRPGVSYEDAHFLAEHLRRGYLLALLIAADTLIDIFAYTGNGRDMLDKRSALGDICQGRSASASDWNATRMKRFAVVIGNGKVILLVTSIVVEVGKDSIIVRE